jgi:ABC-type multidrug transport system fused ATPase/permease subunit
VTDAAADRSGRAQLRAAFRLLSVGNRRRWIVVAVLSMVASVTEIIGGLLIVGLIGSVTPGGEISFPILGDLSDRFQGVDQESLIAWTAAVTAAFFIFRGVLMVVDSYVRSRVVQNAGAVLSARLLEGYLGMPYVELTRRNSAEMIRNTTESVGNVLAYVLVPGVAMFAEVSIVLGLLVLLLVQAPLATVVALVMFAPVVGGMLRVIQPRLGRLGRGSQNEARHTMQAVQEALHGHRDIALLHHEAAFVGRFSRSRFAFARIKYLHATLTEVPRYAIETIATVFVLGYLGVTALQGTSTEDSFAVLGLFAYAAFRVMPSVNRIVASMNNVRFGGPAALDLARDLDTAESYLSTDAEGDGSSMPFEHGLRLEGVTFRYPDSDADAVGDVDVEIRRGESVGFVGPTGGGKSTLVDLAIGLLRPTSGRVAVDGVDVLGRERSWQARLGVVSQTVYLLDDTLRANIAFGLHGDEVEGGAVDDAVALAQLGDLIRSLPDGLDTMIGERGVRLSGGQRQRVAIARALYRRPDVIVFDEGTSALDTVTEEEVVRAVDRLRGDRTILMVAHRISTVRRCDRIHVVDAGRVVAQGTYDELEAGSASFKSLLGG